MRAALCPDAETARGARRWNDANVLAMSLRLATPILAREILDAFLDTNDVDESERDNIARVERGWNDDDPTELLDAGFELDRERAGTQRFARRSNPYLQWWVVLPGDGTAELQWEFELGEYLKAKGFHVSVQDELSLLLFPRTEMRGPAEAGWIAEPSRGPRRSSASVNLVTGE